MNRFEEALAAFQESYKLRPHNPGARMAIITCLGHLGRLTEARAALQGFDSGRIPALSFPNQPDFNQLIHAGLTLARADV
jgi:tetratricopeptide (TPR) repeat protein